MIGSLIMGYLAVGCAVAFIGPGRREIAGQIRSVQGSDISNAILGREAPPKWKVVAFAVIMSLGAVLLWPILLSALVQDGTRRKKDQREWEERVAQGLEFQRMGGAGEIQCGDCGYRQEITSFTHGCTVDGTPCSTSGYQCQACGKFHGVFEQGGVLTESAPRCECGGELSRNRFLFCPKCKSRKLKYEMSYIT
ncbi:MAG: hypothetical protein ACNA7W_21860 [Pseudomonadales bacterium]